MKRRRVPVRFPQRECCFAPAPKIMRPKILLVDDDPAIREMLGRVLTCEGYVVLPAANGEEALALAAATEMDLLLLDLNLPVKNGWETFEKITAENPVLPIIIITARPNQLFPVLAAGAGALMEKPLDFPKLLQIIRALLKEPAEIRLDRIAGRPAEFHYAPAQESGKP
jgi:two-component system, OmpR family, KDP operon response regulator KdpE